MKVLFTLVGLTASASGYSYEPWQIEPVIDYAKDPGVSRTVYFVHMRKAAGTAIRQYFRTIYHKLQCLPMQERKLVHPDQENWRCRHLAFYHVEWLCLVGSEVVQIRRRALEANRSGAPAIDAKLTHFYSEKSLRFITCLRHPIDRLISVAWYGESSNGMRFVKSLWESGVLREQAEGENKRNWFRNSIDTAKRLAARNSTLWDSWTVDVDQSTVWNYYVTRLAGGECGFKG